MQTLGRTVLRIAIGGLIFGAVVSWFIEPRQAHRWPPPPPSPQRPVAMPMTATSCHDGCREDFAALTFTPSPTWTRDVPDASTRFSDDGAYFHERGVAFTPPQAYRLSVSFGPHHFLTLDAYSRIPKDPPSLFAVVPDPANPAKRVLRLVTSEHTDGVTIRSTEALGTRYKMCARVGYMNYGTGDGQNGYRGGERNDPWTQGNGDATNENGFYFGAIYRSPPAPHNNLFAHHQRIVFIDSDNNTGSWTSIWDPATRWFFKSGWHPVVMAAVSGSSEESDENGPSLQTYAAAGWHSDEQGVLAVDAYKENTWYTVCLARQDTAMTLQIAGDFRYGGETTYTATLPDASHLFHFNDPHYWLLGDPHINYYEGSLLVGDITLTTS